MNRAEGLEDQIASHIEAEIAEHGHAIVTIHDLAARFDRSTSTIWRELRRMERAGRLTPHQGRKGCYHEVVRT